MVRYPCFGGGKQPPAVTVFPPKRYGQNSGHNSPPCHFLQYPGVVVVSVPCSVATIKMIKVEGTEREN